MDFRDAARKLIDDISGIKTKEKQIDISNQFESVMNEEKDNKEYEFELILEDLDDELNSNPSKYPNKEITLTTDGSVANSFKFLGKLSTAPNPMEYPENSLYKNINEGVVYINNGHLWESLISDGKPGSQGRQGAAGSGTGVKEVETIVKTYTNSTVTSAGNVIFPNAVQAYDGMVTLGAIPRWYPCSVSKRVSTNTQTSASGRTVLDTRVRMIVPQGPGMIRFVFRNCGIDGVQLVETTNLSAVGTIKVNGTMFDGYDNYWCKFTFNGCSYTEIAPGGVAVTDPIPYTYKNNGLIRVKTHVTSTSGFIPAMPIEGSDGISTSGIDLTTSGGGVGYTTGTGYGYMPYCILTDMPTASVFALGDSITDGVGDSGTIAQYNNYLTVGWIRRAAVSAGIGAYVRGFPGAMASQLDFAYNPALGSEMCKIGASKFIFAFGTNDCLYKTTSAIKNDFKAAFTKIKALGFNKIYCALITPQTTSTDSWLTEVNQTPRTGFEPGGVRDQLNSWLLEGADGQIAGVVDTLTGVTNGSVWKARMTSDGTHPSGSGDDITAVGNAASIMAYNAIPLFLS